MSDVLKPLDMAADTQPCHPTRRGWPGLSAKLLLLTVLFVMIAEVLIFVPSAANFRNTWLEDRLSSARIAVVALEAAPQNMLPPEMEKMLLQSTGVLAISAKRDEKRLLLAAGAVQGQVRYSYDVNDRMVLTVISQTLSTLFNPQEGALIRAMDDGGMAGDTIEILASEMELQQDLLSFSITITILSLIISLITSALVYLSLHLMFVRPVRRLMEGMVRFTQSPEEAKHLMVPTGRRDEIGQAEEQLVIMQKELQGLLKQKNNLANLGLAVSKINHDLRNMLTGAQLVADRLSLVKDPVVERFTPRILSSLDRALLLCETTLKYGKASEREPLRETIKLKELAAEVFDALALADDAPVQLVAQINDGLQVDADREQLFRVLLNLCRNAVQVLREVEGEKIVTVQAMRTQNGVVIEVRDTGPGVPTHLRTTLFQPFQNAKQDGVGLGLAISHELITAHGGEIKLLDQALGAVFQISLPDTATLSTGTGNGKGRLKKMALR